MELLPGKGEKEGNFFAVATFVSAVQKSPRTLVKQKLTFIIMMKWVLQARKRWSKRGEFFSGRGAMAMGG